VTKVALITSVTGQDGAYLAEFLLDKGYVVHEAKINNEPSVTVWGTGTPNVNFSIAMTWQKPVSL